LEDENSNADMHHRILITLVIGMVLGGLFIAGTADAIANRAATFIPRFFADEVVLQKKSSSRKAATSSW
jgi:hypothetical protein